MSRWRKSPIRVKKIQVSTVKGCILSLEPLSLIVSQKLQNAKKKSKILESGFNFVPLITRMAKNDTSLPQQYLFGG